MKLLLAFFISFLFSALVVINPFTSSENTPSVTLSDESDWQLVSTNNEPLARHENAFTELNGKFYLIGGRTNKPINIFDPATNTWSEGATPPLEMHHFQALPYQGKIYVLGAFTGGFPRETPVPDVYTYDLATDKREIVASIPEDRRRGAAGVVAYQDKIYVVCGIQDGHYDGHVCWLDEFDPATGEWTKLADAPRTRDHFQAAVIGDRLLAAAGRNTSAKTGKTMELTIAEVDVYDFNSGKWETLEQPLPTLRAGTASVVQGNQLIVIGGESGEQVPAHSEVEAYSFGSKKWSHLANLQQGRHGTHALIYQDTIFVAAGSGNRGGGPELTSMEKFSP
ncbi:MAG: Kelch repeat-containing protein [Cyclobacteriaceae bacterium]